MSALTVLGLGATPFAPRSYVEPPLAPTELYPQPGNVKVSLFEDQRLRSGQGVNVKQSTAVNRKRV